MEPKSPVPRMEEEDDQKDGLNQNIQNTFSIFLDEGALNTYKQTFLPFLMVFIDSSEDLTGVLTVLSFLFLQQDIKKVLHLMLSLQFMSSEEGIQLTLVSASLQMENLLYVSNSAQSCLRKNLKIITQLICLISLIKWSLLLLQQILSWSTVLRAQCPLYQSLILLEISILLPLLISAGTVLR